MNERIKSTTSQSGQIVGIAQITHPAESSSELLTKRSGCRRRRRCRDDVSLFSFSYHPPKLSSFSPSNHNRLRSASTKSVLTSSSSSSFKINSIINTIQQLIVGALRLTFLTLVIGPSFQQILQHGGGGGGGGIGVVNCRRQHQHSSLSSSSIRIPNKDYYRKQQQQEEQVAESEFYRNRRITVYDKGNMRGVECYSCMSTTYEAGWDKLQYVYQRPATFTDHCNHPSFGPSHAIGTVNCSNICVTLKEPQFSGGVYLGDTVIRGCLDKVLVHGFNETAIDTHRFRHFDLCRHLKRADLMKPSASGMPMQGDVQMCACYGNRCNAVSAGTSVRPTIDLLSVSYNNRLLPFFLTVLFLFVHWSFAGQRL